METCILILLDTCQVCRNYQGKDKSIVHTRKEYMPLLAGLIKEYTAANFNNMLLCIPMQIKKKSNVANNIDNNLMTANNFLSAL